jgi:hypothetical protein
MQLIRTSYSTVDEKWNGSPQQHIRGQHGESDHYFFRIASNHRAAQSEQNIKPQIDLLLDQIPTSSRYPFLDLHVYL